MVFHLPVLPLSPTSNFRDQLSRTKFTSLRIPSYLPVCKALVPFIVGNYCPVHLQFPAVNCIPLPCLGWHPRLPGCWFRYTAVCGSRPQCAVSVKLYKPTSIEFLVKDMTPNHDSIPNSIDDACWDVGHCRFGHEPGGKSDSSGSFVTKALYLLKEAHAVNHYLKLPRWGLGTRALLHSFGWLSGYASWFNTISAMLSAKPSTSYDLLMSHLRCATLMFLDAT